MELKIKEINEDQLNLLKSMCEQLFTVAQFTFVDIRTCHLRFILKGNRLVSFHWFELCIMDIPMALFGEKDYFDESAKILVSYEKNKQHPVDYLYEICKEKGILRAA